MARTAIRAWCTCGHHAAWHIDGGPCAYTTTEYRDGEVVDVGDCECGQLELGYVECDLLEPGA